MPRIPKSLALATGVFAALAAAALQAQEPTSTGSQTVVVSGGLTWLEESDVAARREGVVKNIEFIEGDRIEADQEIGSLHDEIAALNLKKAEVIAKSVGAEEKAKAQRGQAISTLTRIYRLEGRGRDLVTPEEKEKAEADVKYAEALILEAQEKRMADEAEMELARTILAEHHITPPFAGVVVERHVNPGEAVQANQPVIRIGKTDKFKFVGWIPLEAALQVRRNDQVQFRPSVEGSDLPIEHMTFTGKVMSISNDISRSGGATLSLLAEIDNPPHPDQPGLELIQGMRGELTILLGMRGANPPAPAPNGAGLGNGQAALPTARR